MQTKIKHWLCVFQFLLSGCVHDIIVEERYGYYLGIDELLPPKTVLFCRQEDKVALENANAMDLIPLLAQLRLIPYDPMYVMSVEVENSSYPLTITCQIVEAETSRVSYIYTFIKNKGKWDVNQVGLRSRRKVIYD